MFSRGLPLEGSRGKCMSQNLSLGTGLICFRVLDGFRGLGWLITGISIAESAGIILCNALSPIPVYFLHHLYPKPLAPFVVLFYTFFI